MSCNIKYNIQIICLNVVPRLEIIVLKKLFEMLLKIMLVQLKTLNTVKHIMLNHIIIILTCIIIY